MKVTIKIEAHDTVNTIIVEDDDLNYLPEFLNLWKKAAVLAGFAINVSDELEIISYDEEK
jgi:hypothetical protein